MGSTVGMRASWCKISPPLLNSLVIELSCRRYRSTKSGRRRPSAKPALRMLCFAAGAILPPSLPQSLRFKQTLRESAGSRSSVDSRFNRLSLFSCGLYQCVLFTHRISSSPFAFRRPRIQHNTKSNQKLTLSKNQHQHQQQQ